MQILKIESGHNYTLNLSLNEEFQIKASFKPSTGYKWTIVMPREVEVQREWLEPSNPEVLGSDVGAVWILKVLSENLENKYQLKFMLLRSWCAGEVKSLIEVDLNVIPNLVSFTP